MVRSKNPGSDDAVISIIGPQLRVVGDLDTQGTVRIEGHVDGDIQAGKAVVVGKDGEVQGDIRTEDSVISGRVRGSVRAASRLEIQATAHIDGEVHARRLQLEEGAVLNGTVRMGEVDLGLEGVPDRPARSGGDGEETAPEESGPGEGTPRSGEPAASPGSAGPDPDAPETP